MKILVVQDHLRSGGTERQSILLAQAFAANGHSCELLTFRPGGALAGMTGAIRNHVLQPVDLKLDWYAPGLSDSIRKIGPDIILCMGRMANCWAGRIQRTIRSRGSFASVVSTMRTGKSLPFFFRRSLQAVAHVVANSQDAKNVLVENYRMSATKVSVIRNSLVFSPHQDGLEMVHLPGRIRLRRQMDAGPSTCVLLNVGMFRPEKNQRGLIDLAAQIPRETDFQLWLAGEGRERATCEAAVEAAGLTKYIKFLGFQPDPRELYDAADIAVLTSRSESLSNFLIEAHAHGLPSVAYSVMGVAECGGIAIPPENRDAFFSALVPLMTNRIARTAESARVRAYARENFSPTARAAEYLELFARLRTAAS